MTDSISPNRVEEILTALNDYTIDCEKITLAEFMQATFLQVMFGGDEVDLNVNKHMMYGGNLFNIHVCVAQINPNQPVKALKRTQ